MKVYYITNDLVPGEEVVVIDRKAFEAIQDEAEWLDCLYAAGLDSDTWDGFDIAWEILEARRVNEEL